MPRGLPLSERIYENRKQVPVIAGNVGGREGTFSPKIAAMRTFGKQEIPYSKVRNPDHDVVSPIILTLFPIDPRP